MKAFIQPSYRQATADDAPFLAKCVREVSHGVVDGLLEGVLPGLDAEAILSMVLRDASSQYSYKNCVLTEQGASILALLFCYPASAQTIPPMMRVMLPAARLTSYTDIVTAVVPESLYINTIWVDPSVRGQGLADVLLDYAAFFAKESGLTKLSLLAWRDNSRALAFYAKHGFTTVRSVRVPESLEGGADLYERLLV